MNLPDQPATSQPGRSHRGDCSSVSVFVFAWFLIAAVAFGRVLTGIGLTLFDSFTSPFAPFLLALGQSGILVFLLVAPAAKWKNLFHRGIFRSWLAAAGFGGLASFIHLTPPYAVQLHALLHIAAAAVYILLIWILAGRPRPLRHSRSQNRLWMASILIAVVFAYPWLAWGAFGSTTDTFLQLLAALFLGLSCALTLELFLFPVLLPAQFAGERTYQTAPAVGITGVAAGTVLLLLSSGMAFGYHVMQLLLMLSLPPLGFILVSLTQFQPSEEELVDRERRLNQGRLLPLALLVGAAAAAPMTLVDPAELYLLASLGTGEILQWALSAAIVSGFTALLMGAGLLTWLRPRRNAPSSPESPPPASKVFDHAAPKTAQHAPVWLIGAAALTILAGGLIYYFAGQPGAYGDTLFVVLHDQWDVSTAAQLEDLSYRRQFVYTQMVEHAEMSQASLREELNRFNLRYTPYYLVNGIEVHGGPLLRIWLLSRPEVDRVLDNPRMRPLPAERPRSTGTASLPPGVLWNLEMIHAPRAWEEFGTTGEGIVIGQSDSGVEWEHRELALSYRGMKGEGDQPSHGYNWFDPWYGSQEPVDISGHGTHTLGSVLGQQTGVAPGATWFGCSNLSRNLGNPALYLDCMQFMLAPFPFGGDPFRDGDTTLAADVLNNSWSCPEVEGCDPESLLAAVRALRAAGIFVVVSAGNDGPACESIKQPPALYAEVLSVGAVDSQGRLAFFSSLGPVTVDGSGRIKPDLVAPGFEVVSAMPGNTYAAQSGTSMAGPHAAGVVALMWSANPALVGDIERTEQILHQSTQPYTGSLPDCSGAESIPSTAVGYGLLDAYEAVRLAVGGE
jgi:hypothetical protein